MCTLIIHKEVKGGEWLGFLMGQVISKLIDKLRLGLTITTYYLFLKSVLFFKKKKNLIMFISI